MVSPPGALTAAERTAIREDRQNIVRIVSTVRSDVRPPAPTEPCGMCLTSAWFFDATWNAYLCATCAERPGPTLREVAASLSAEDRARLDAEAADGDPLAQTILAELRKQTALEVGETIARALGPTGAGWVVIYSRTLGQEVVLTRDETVPVPEAFGTLARFTRAELAELARIRPDGALLSKIIEGKDAFGTGTRLVDPEVWR